MNDTADMPPRRTSRPRRVVVAVALLAALAWFARWGYTRATTRPPGAPTYESVLVELAPPPPYDVKDALAETIAQLPASPYRSFTIAAGTRGEWKPWTRAIINDIQRYLDLPASRAVLDRLTELSDGHVRLGDSYADHRYFGTAEALLLVRARDRWEGRHDTRGAISDLRTALQIARMAHERPGVVSVLSGVELEHAALNELMWLASLPEDSIDAVASLRTLAEDVRKSPPPNIDGALEMSRALDIRSLDGLYTRMDDGNGLVDVQALSIALPNYGAAPPPNELTPFGGIWNVFASAFHDRRTVLAKIDERYAILSAVSTATDDELIALLQRFEDCIEHTTILDGPLTVPDRMARIIHYVLDASMQREAVCTVIAIEQFRRSNGALPAALEVLVPEYLEQVPRDRYVDAALRYRRDDDKFVLYSVGRDQTDDSANSPLADLLTYRDYESRSDVILNCDRPPATDPFVWFERLNANWPAETDQPDADGTAGALDAQ